MKFSKGEWLMQPGVTAYNCEQIRDIQVSDDKTRVDIFAVPYREDVRSIDGPALEMTITSPMPDIIRIQLVHWKGYNRNLPHYDITDERVSFDTQSDDSGITLITGDTKLVINKRDNCTLTFYYKDKKLTNIGERYGAAMLSHIQTPDGSYIRAQLQVDVGEKIYGLGERFTPFLKNGQTVDMWNEDGGTSSELSYKNIPFYMSSRNYGVFVNDSGPVSFEVCSEAVTKVQFSLPGEILDFMVIGADSRKNILKKYTALVGRPALVPAWSFGLWLTSSFTTSYDEETVSGFVDGMKSRDIPLSVFHYDCFWMKENTWCGFEWDEDKFPDPKSMISRMHEKGLRVCVWINPYLGQKSKVFDECAQKGYLLKKPNGDIWQWDLWQAGLAVYDFTNPECVSWYQDKVRELLRLGVDAIKTDFGERIPTDVIYHDGSDPERMHNYYTYIYNKLVFDVIEKERGVGDAILFARSAAVGGQKFPIHWGGDSNSTYVSMAESLRAGLSLCLSGFGYWSHDIGGFEGSATPDLYKRWLAFGLLSSHSRLHGSTNYRVPWLFGDEAVDVCRYFSKLKNTLMPYLYAKAVEAHETGVPMMRAMMLEFEDIACEDLDRQYMLGDALLVAPVFSEDGEVDYYLPDGTWTHLLSGDVRQGGSWQKDRYDYYSLPLYVRENTILPVGSVDSSPEYDYSESLILKIYCLQDGACAERTIYDTSGKILLTVKATRKSDTITVEMSGKSDSVSIEQIGTECRII